MKGIIHCSEITKDLLILKLNIPSKLIIGHKIGSTFRLSALQSPGQRGIKKTKSRIKHLNKLNSKNESSSIVSICLFFYSKQP